MKSQVKVDIKTSRNVAELEKGTSNVRNFFYEDNEFSATSITTVTWKNLGLQVSVTALLEIDCCVEALRSNPTGIKMVIAPNLLFLRKGFLCQDVHVTGHAKQCKMLNS